MGKEKWTKITKKMMVCNDHKRKPLLFNPGLLDDEEEKVVPPAKQATTQP
jgi:hypothetical protein